MSLSRRLLWFVSPKLLLHASVLAALVCVLGVASPIVSRAQSRSPSSGAVQTPSPDSIQERRSLLRAARAAKSERLESAERASLESLLLWVEDRRVLEKIGGVGAEEKRFRFGPAGLGSGAGLGLQVMYVPFSLRRDLDVRLHAGGSTRGYWRFGGSVGYRYNPVFAHLYSQVRKRPQRTYFLELQNTTDLEESRRFDITTWSTGGVLGVRLLPSLSLAASSSYLRYSSAVGAAEMVPRDPNILNPATTTRYLSVSGHLRLDRRNVRYGEGFGNRFVPSSDNLTSRSLNPESGTLVSLNVTQFQELSDVDADFYQVEGELQQYVSFFNGYHTFALRHRTVFTGPEDATVPFYQLPYVGGTSPSGGTTSTASGGRSTDCSTTWNTATRCGTTRTW